MRTLNIGVLVCCAVMWVLTACTSSPALPSIGLKPTAVPIVTPAASPTMPPPPSSLQALPPTPFPSLGPPQLSPTRLRTGTVPAPTMVAGPTSLNTALSVTRTPTKAPLQPSRSPTVPSEGWDTHTLLVGPGNPGRLYALQGDLNARYFNSAKRRLLISDDLGETWKPFSGGLPVAPTCLANIDLDYATREALYASTCQGLFRWSGDKWTLTSSQVTDQVAIVYGRPQEMWAVAPLSKGGPVLRSDDGGRSWRSASDDLVHFSGLATLGIDPRNAQTVYGIIMPKYAGSYLRRMFVGDQWRTLPTPLSNSQIETWMTIDGATGDLYVTVRPPFQDWQLWRTHNPQESDERAVVWEKVSEFSPGPWAYAGVLASGGTPQGLALFVKLAPTNCSAFDARCDPFVQRSVDGGKTWKRLVIR